MKKEEIIIGTKVIYWAVIKADGSKHDPFETEISSEPWEMGSGHTVCKVLGKSGGVSIEHLEAMEVLPAKDPRKSNGIDLGEFKEPEATKELGKWSFEWSENAMKYWICDGVGRLVISVTEKDTARRIVACLNACIGLQTEYLETVKLVDELFQKQRYFVGKENGIEDITPGLNPEFFQNI